jgi:fructose 1,6-bisphosphatase
LIGLIYINLFISKTPKNNKNTINKPIIIVYDKPELKYFDIKLFFLFANTKNLCSELCNANEKNVIIEINEKSKLKILKFSNPRYIKSCLDIYKETNKFIIIRTYKSVIFFIYFIDYWW